MVGQKRRVSQGLKAIAREIQTVRDYLALRGEKRSLLTLKCELAALRFKAILLRYQEDWRGKAGFRRDQPRWPKGSGDDSGRWSGGAGTAAPGAEQKPTGPTRGGHHFVPRKLFDNEPLIPETRKVFEQGVTGPLKGQIHRGDKDNETYYQGVKDAFERFKAENGIRSEDMSPVQAKEFLDSVRGSSDPRIFDYNIKILRREFLYYLRRIPRRAE